MDIVSDIMVNFNDYYCDSFEWKSTDSLLIIQEIPVLKIEDRQMVDLLHSIIQLENCFFQTISHKSKSIDFLLFSGLLVITETKALVLKFNDQGIVDKKSSLLLDEESAIIDECKELPIVNLSYKIICQNTSLLFLTRKEKAIQNAIMEKLSYYYNKHDFAVIQYLYHEFFEDVQPHDTAYQLLVNEIQQQTSPYLEKIYSTVQLIV